MDKQKLEEINKKIASTELDLKAMTIEYDKLDKAILKANRQLNELHREKTIVRGEQITIEGVF